MNGLIYRDTGPNYGAEATSLYAPQPETMADVQSAIDAYIAAGYSSMARPRWQYEVSSALMPGGWRSGHLENGETGVYWTFFSIPNESVNNYSDLSAAIGRAPANGTLYTIEITGDILSFSTALTIASGKNIIIRSDTAIPWALTKNTTGFHFTVNGALTLENIVLDGNRDGTSSSRYGGVTVSGGGIFTMNDGTVIQNCRGPYGGGVYVSGANAAFTMNGGAVRNNIASSGGGGVYTSNGGFFAVYGGVIEYNETTGTSANGGGVFVYASNFDTYDGAVIRLNTVIGKNSEGAGVFVNEGEFNMHGGAIEQNEAAGTNTFGGGVSVWDSEFYMFDGVINGNTSADGGGVNTDGSYFNMTGGAIYGNTARGGGTVTVIGVGDVGTFGGRGGGVMANTFSDFEMTGGEIHDNRGEPGVNTSGLNSFNGPAKGGGVYVYYGSSFSMEGNAGITGNTANKGGGIAAVGTSLSSNSIVMSGGAAVTANNADDGGGVCFLVGHTSYNFYVGSNSLTMSGSAAITGNTSNGYGGGVYMFSVNITGENTRNSLTMSGRASVSGNSAGLDGGGVYMNIVTNGNAGNILSLYESAAIMGNAANGNGGGVYIDGAETPVSSITLNDYSVITLNDASNANGGGIYAAARGFLEVTGPSLITDNSAPRGDGGGIYTAATTYDNLITGSGTAFRGNTASRAFLPPAGASVIYPNIQFESTSITNHPLNNYDINYTSGEPLAYYHVIYDANGGAGSYTGPDIEAGGSDTVLSPEAAGISREGYSFTGWNTQPDGGGLSYAPGELVVLIGNITLFAQWGAAGLYTVTYNANGGDGGYMDTGIPSGAEYMILSPEAAGISREGYSFTGWNTQPDGGGLSYTPGELIIITGNITLFAQWAAGERPCRDPCCMPCRDPCCKSCCDPCCSKHRAH